MPQTSRCLSYQRLPRWRSTIAAAAFLLLVTLVLLQSPSGRDTQNKAPTTLATQKVPHVDDDDLFTQPDRASSIEDAQGQWRRLCPQFPAMMDEVAVIVKTGATEIFPNIPSGILAVSRCLPNIMIFSSLEQQIGPLHFHDALENVTARSKELYHDFQYYNRLHEVYDKTGNVSALMQDENWGDNSWSLDKWKNVPMLHRAYLHYKDRGLKWYVFMDADTYISFGNLAMKLDGMNHRHPYYMGLRHTYRHVDGVEEDLEFAHGGQGYIISEAAAEHFEQIYDFEHIAKWENATFHGCCGDAILGMAMKEAGVNVTSLGAMMTRSPPSEIEWTPWLSCMPSLSWHHVPNDVVENLWLFERAWTLKEEARPIYYRGIFDSQILPYLTDYQSDWDNLSSDTPANFPVGTSNPAHCRGNCQNETECIQWTWKAPNTCAHHKSIKLGHQVLRGLSDTGRLQAVSGWMMDRVTDFDREQRKKTCMNILQL